MITKRSSRCAAGFEIADQREQPAPEVAVRRPLELLARAGERLLEAIAIERLQQVVERVDVERASAYWSKAVTKTTSGIRAGAERVDDVEAGGAGHLDVEEHEVRLGPPDGVDRARAVRALGDDLDPVLPASSIRSRSRASGSSSAIRTRVLPIGARSASCDPHRFVTGRRAGERESRSGPRGPGPPSENSRRWPSP